jgi:predicted ester cyclase
MAEENATIARRLYEDWNKRDFEHFAGLFAPSSEIVLVGSGMQFKGREGAKQFAQMWADGFPDGKVKIEKLLGSGNQLAVEYTGTGKHTGPLAAPGGEIPPTGRSVTLQLCDVIEFRDAKVSKLRSYFDAASLLAQLGVIPETRARAIR